MNKKTDFKTALNLWAEYHPEQGSHIPPGKIWQFAQAGGIQGAAESEIEHLSLCPRCLDTWGVFVSLLEVEAADEYESTASGVIITYGHLQAAATSDIEAMLLTSACGQFQLGIFPGADDSSSGMATLEIIGNQAGSCEGMSAGVRDAENRMILKGTIRHNRTAFPVKKIHELNLSTWTVVIVPQQVS